MKRCAQCHGKLGLGIRARNVWNGRWWLHVRFVRRIVKLFTSWSDTTATQIAGASSWLASIRRADLLSGPGNRGTGAAALLASPSYHQPSHLERGQGFDEWERDRPRSTLPASLGEDWGASHRRISTHLNHQCRGISWKTKRGDSTLSASTRVGSSQKGCPADPRLG